MNDQKSRIIQIRAKKLGLLMYDARTARKKTVEECAFVLNIKPERYVDYESGEQCPSLPEIELLAHFLDIPIDHFFGDSILTTQFPSKDKHYYAKLNQIRNNMIAVQLQISRESLNLTLEDVAEKTSIPIDKIMEFESGIPIPIAELSILTDIYHLNMEDFVDHNGPIGTWLEDKKRYQKYQELPPHILEFISSPVNQPYLELAIKLSKLPAAELRQIAENILQITL